jgi:hypothetical protein
MRRLVRIIIELVAMAASATTVRAEGTSVSPPWVPKVAALETQLHRGISTKADVERFLGPPTGSGGAELPGDSIGRGIWYYGHIEVTNKLAYGWLNPGWIRVATGAQQTLLIFFEGDLYSGFLWVSYPAAP